MPLMTRMLAIVALVGSATSLDQAVASASNAPTIVMDVRDEYVFCDARDPCEPPNQPQINILEIHHWFWVYVFARNYDNIAGIQWAFDWPPTLTVSNGHWLCPPGSIGIPEQPPYGPGPVYGSCGSVFNCITGGASQVIGVVGVFPGSGCLEIIDSAFPGGTSVITCSGDVVPIAPPNRGKVCVGEGGVNACEPVVPVMPATWGSIKESYR